MEILTTFYKLLGNYVSVFPLLIGIVRIRKLNSAFLFLLFMIVCETGVAVYSRWQGLQGINNLPSLHLMTFLELLFGGTFFYFSLKVIRLKRILLFLSIAFLLYTTLNSLVLQSIYVYNHIPRTLEGYLFVVFSFFYFYELLKSPDLIQLSKSAEFWAVIAFFTYFGTTQFVHLFSDYTRENHNYFYVILRQLNFVMVIIYYTLFSIAFLKKGKNKQQFNESKTLSFQ